MSIEQNLAASLQELSRLRQLAVLVGEPQEHLDGRGVCMKGDRFYYYCPQKFVACLDARSGRVVWKTSDPTLLEAIGLTGRAQNAREGYATSSFIKCNDKYVFFAGPQRPNLVVVSALDGKLVWRKTGGNLHLILQDDAFYAVGPGGAKMAYDTWATLGKGVLNARRCDRECVQNSHWRLWRIPRDHIRH